MGPYAKAGRVAARFGPEKTGPKIGLHYPFCFFLKQMSMKGDAKGFCGRYKRKGRHPQETRRVEQGAHA